MKMKKLRSYSFGVVLVGVVMLAAEAPKATGYTCYDQSRQIHYYGSEVDCGSGTSYCDAFCGLCASEQSWETSDCGEVLSCNNGVEIFAQCV
jgi:hypothetical protein